MLPMHQIPQMPMYPAFCKEEQWKFSVTSKLQVISLPFHDVKVGSPIQFQGCFWVCQDWDSGTESTAEELHEAWDVFKIFAALG